MAEYGPLSQKVMQRFKRLQGVLQRFGEKEAPTADDVTAVRALIKADMLFFNDELALLAEELALRAKGAALTGKESKGLENLAIAAIGKLLNYWNAMLRALEGIRMELNKSRVPGEYIPNITLRVFRNTFVVGKPSLYDSWMENKKLLDPLLKLEGFVIQLKAAA